MVTAFRCIAFAFCLLSGLPTGIFVSRSCDRTVPLVLYATDEPIFFLRFVLPAACAHVQ